MSGIPTTAPNGRTALDPIVHAVRDLGAVAEFYRRRHNQRGRWMSRGVQP